MISICCPTRGRPARFNEMVDSALSHARRPDGVEVIAYLDIDDPERHAYGGSFDSVRFIVGDRLTLSQCWNECARLDAGNIVMHGGDDIVFRSFGWDVIVERAFADCPDGILLVHGDDGGDHPQEFATHGFVSRRWVDTVGYLCPPYFDSDMNDRWLSEVADELGRRQRVDIVTEHMHPLWGKGELDLTHRERMERHAAQRPDLLYDAMAAERAGDVAKLRAAMA